MGQVAYNAVVKAAGTSTPFLDAATTNTSGTTYQITDATKRTLDRDSSVLVEVAGVIVEADTYEVNYFTGTVTFNNAPAGAVTITASYFPMVTIVGANQYSVELMGDVLDDTSFNTNGFRSRKYGLTDVSVSISSFDDLEKVYKEKLVNRQTCLLEITPGGKMETIMGWFIIETASSEGEVSALEMESLSFQLDGDIKSSFYWS